MKIRDDVKIWLIVLAGLLMIGFVVVTPTWAQPFSERECLELQLSRAALPMGTVTDTRSIDTFHVTCYVEIDNDLWYKALSRDFWERVSSGLEK